MSDAPRGPDHDRADDAEPESDGPENATIQSLEDILAEHRDEEAGPDEQAGTDGDTVAEPDPYDPFAPVQDPESDGEGDTDDDTDDLPDAPLFGLLRTLAAEITPERIDRVWVFPPRRIEVAETAVVVVTAFLEPGDNRRRVFAAHYTALDDSDEHRLAVAEYGTAPTDRVGRLVEEAVERIKDGPAGAPRSIRIDGDPQRWDEALHELAGRYLEERQRDRRLR